LLGGSSARTWVDTSVAAIALHSDASADRSLRSLLATGNSTELREKAALWLGSVRGGVGLQVLQDEAKKDSPVEVREAALFGFYVSPIAGAVDEITQMAVEDSSPKVRGKALFWLAKRGSKDSAAAIARSVNTDPDVGVMKAGIFALTQMPHNEGVPYLREAAKNHAIPEIRQEARFWLAMAGMVKGDRNGINIP
jgi:HEAT repeat protein